jgi:RNA polymerase sigma factor (sigma-70 family)
MAAPGAAARGTLVGDRRMFSAADDMRMAWSRAPFDARMSRASRRCAAMADEPPDLELLEAWRQGDPDAGQALFKRHYDAIYRFFESKAPVEAVQELVQETFATLVRKRDTFAGSSLFRAYLFGIARNHLYEHFREHRRALRHEDIDFGKLTAEALGGSPTSVLGHAQEHRLLRLALTRIPLEHQILLELYLWEELTGPQLAQIMGVPENTMRSRLRRAKDLLEQEFQSLVDDPAQARSALETLSGWVDEVQHEARRAFPQLKDE